MERSGLIRMPETDAYLNEIDAARVLRAKEPSEIKRIFNQDVGTDPSGVQSKAVIVLSYANWEGFYNECIRIYVKFLKENRVAVAEASWLLLVGALSSDFESLRAKNHSSEAKRLFVENLRFRLECNFEDFDKTVIEARSNLDFKKLSSNLALLGFDVATMQRSRIRLDKQLVGWRHEIAHGSAPDLSGLDISAHITFTSDLLLTVSDIFQKAIQDRA